MPSLSGTIDAYCYRNSTNTSVATAAWTSYAKSAASVGVNSNGYICTGIVKFTTPAFKGRCTNLQIKVPFIKGSASSAPTSYTLNYAISSSDANKAAYVTTSAVTTSSDPYQLAKGTVTLSGLTASLQESTCVNLSINAGTSNNISTVKPSTTYYLFFWPTDSTKNKIVQNWWSTSYHTMKVTYEYISGVFMPSAGGTVYAYDVYIADTSGSIVPCDVYIGNTDGKPVLSYIP